MFDGLKKIIEKIINLSASLDKYEKDAVVKAIPSLAFVNRAKNCIEAGNLAEAEKILTEAKELPQEDALVFKYLGLIYERTSRLQDAVSAYKKSAGLNSSDKEIWKFLGFALMNAGQITEAETAFKNANKISSMNTDVFAGWGMTLMKQKRYDEAHEKFMEAVRTDKYNFMALLLAAVMEVRTGNYNDAETKLRFLSNANPTETCSYEYANLKYIKGDYDNAIHYAVKSLEFNKNLLPAYLLLGKLYAIKGQREESLRMYEEACERELISQYLYFDWGVTLQIFDDFAGAKEKFEKALELYSNDNEMRSGIALSLAGLGQIEQAQEIIDDIRDLNDTNYLYSKTKALIAFNKGNYKDAVDRFKTIKDNIPFDISLNCRIACAYEHLNDTVNAKEYFEKSLVENHIDTKIYLKYSEFLIRNGEFDNAQRKLKRALKLKDNDMKILNLLFHVSYILVKQNNCEYNIKEALSIGDRIKSINEEEFEYMEEYSILKDMYKQVKS